MRGTRRTTHIPLVLVTLLAVATACTDRMPPTSPGSATQDDVAEPAGTRSVVASVTCIAHVMLGELSCGKVPVVDRETGLQRVILGGQGVFVLLTSTNVGYDPGTEIFQADVDVNNLIPQGLGSADGLNTTGVRVFHHTGPTVTGGTGTASVANADGTGTFTGTNQPYHLYDEYIPPLLVSQKKTWQWSVQSGVTTFEFEVYVDADVANPDGFVVMSPGSALMAVAGPTVTVTGTPVDVVGRPVAGTVTYSSSDPTVADVNPSTGVVTALSAGIVDIFGSTGGPEANGRTRITVDPPTAGFDIDLHFIMPPSASQELAFNNAAARWESLITGDLPTELVTINFIFCGGLVDEYVDDLAINVLLAPIDGPGKTLGFAAPCWIRSATGLTAFGFMQFDTDDVAQLEADGQFEDVVLHEMGHVLGFGTLWDLFGLLRDNNGILTREECFPSQDDPPPLTTDPFFSGPAAVTAFANSGGGSYVGNPVPVENDFGPGTRCVHWRESVMDNELMTGFTEPPPAPPPPAVWMPLSEVTVQSLADMGYTVATAGWDTWSCPFCAPPALGAAAVDATAGGLQLINDVWLGPVYSRDEQGRVIEVLPDRRR